MFLSSRARNVAETEKNIFKMIKKVRDIVRTKIVKQFIVK